ncbi:MAG: hypothetical protein ACFCU3_04255 [Verrucomicrobiales bacterium]
MENSELRARIIDAVISHKKEQRWAPEQTEPSAFAVGSLCRFLQISEKEFYQVFPSLDAVEGFVWKDWFLKVSTAVAAGAEWESFTARQRYMAFLYAQQEAALEQRTLLLQELVHVPVTVTPGFLQKLKAEFHHFAKTLMNEGREKGEIACRGKLNDGYPGLLYLHYRSVLSFFLKDESEGFERTDAYIEKSSQALFDALGKQVIDSAVDLIRFLAPWQKTSK